MAIGYLANGAKEAKQTISAQDALLSFDSGRGISFEDGLRHLGVFGATGMGKTAQAIIPAMQAAIEKGGMILIIDPKGTLGGYARSIAQACSRGDEVLEFGTSESATPINLISGMAPARFFNLAMDIFRRFTDGGKSHNMDFHASACSQARDIFTVLQGIEALAAKQANCAGGERPTASVCTLPLILDLLNDPAEATQIFEAYMRAETLTPALRRFAKRIQRNVFHILNQTKDNDEIDNEHEQQVAYNSTGAINAFTQFLGEAGIM